ncbi:MAG: GFA family protein, partial [Alphaproteobacteria bacterium]
MKLEGSCHCGAVRFTVESRTPYPFMRCYCSICRKTAGGGGYAINIMGETATLEVDGEDNVAVYRVALARTAEGEGADPDERSPARRRFCKLCGSALWLFDPRWPELVHPFASAIDTPLP